MSLIPSRGGTSLGIQVNCVSVHALIFHPTEAFWRCNAGIISWTYIKIQDAPKMVAFGIKPSSKKCVHNLSVWYPVLMFTGKLSSTKEPGTFLGAKMCLIPFG